MRVGGPNNVGRAVQTDPILVPYASEITEQKECGEFLTHKFDQFITFCNNSLPHATTCNKACKRTQHDIQRCCVRFDGLKMRHFSIK